MELYELIEELRNEKNMGSWEGSRGLENLCKLVRAIGYRDPQHQLQFRDGCVGDLIEFLEDNSGAIEAVVTWIGEQNIKEWKENLESELPEKECEDCGHPVHEGHICPDSHCLCGSEDELYQKEIP